MQSASSVHGHEIIDLIAAHPAGIQISELSALVESRYGKGASFHTCSADGMDLPELLTFLDQRGKASINGDTVSPGTSPACDH